MEWIAMITLLCSSAQMKSKNDCQAHYKKCVEWIVEQPQSKEKDLSKFEAALWIKGYPKVRKQLCD